MMSSTPAHWAGGQICSPPAFAPSVPLQLQNTNSPSIARRRAIRLAIFSRAQPKAQYVSPDPSSQTPLRATGNNIYFATCARGLGEYLARELTSSMINAQILSIHSSGVRFTSSEPEHLTAYRACLWLRAATRVLYQLHSQEVTERGYALGNEVYEIIRSCANWDALLAGKRSFSVQARVSNRTGISERGVAVCTKDAICDCLMERREPPPRYEDADVCVFVAVDDVIEVYLDMGGGSLHKRGYRNGVVHKAALNECVAAGMAYMAGFTPDGEFESGNGDVGKGKGIVLADPMCGSGTLLIETGLLWLRVAVGLFRQEFGCERWPDYNETAMERIRDEAINAQRTGNEDGGLRLLGGDSHRGALGLAKEGMHTTRLNDIMELWRGDVNDMNIGDVDVTLCNPPWGMRLESEGAWEGLGQFLRRGGEGVACVLSGAKGGSRALRMRTKRKIPVRVGGVDARVLVYDILPRR